MAPLCLVARRSICASLPQAARKQEGAAAAAPPKKPRKQEGAAAAAPPKKQPNVRACGSCRCGMSSTRAEDAAKHDLAAYVGVPVRTPICFFAENGKYRQCAGHVTRLCAAVGEFEVTFAHGDVNGALLADVRQDMAVHRIPCDICGWTSRQWPGCHMDCPCFCDAGRTAAHMALCDTCPRMQHHRCAPGTERSGQGGNGKRPSRYTCGPCQARASVTARE